MTRTQAQSWTIIVLFLLLIVISFARAAPLPQEPGYVPPSYWTQFPATKGKWDQASFYPVGVWLQNVSTSQETTTDKAIGINTYVAITSPSNPAVVRSAGMYILQQWEVTSQTPAGIHTNYGAETVGWLVGDEHDMQYGPGWSAWDGIYYDTVSGFSHCVPKTSGCGYTVSQTTKGKFPKTGRFYAENYGKGVLFWQSEAQAQVWLNSGFQDAPGVDMYWHHDKDGCASTQGGRLARAGYLVGTGAPDGFGGGEPTLTPEECARSSNFAAAQEKLRDLDAIDGKFQPLWCFVEVGVTPQQLQGEVMACLISGSYPVYFNHVFETSGPERPCITQQALRDSCYAGQRAAATAINGLIKELAPVLNSPRLVWDFQAPKLVTRLSQVSGIYYAFAMQAQGSSGTYTLALPADAPASAVETCSGTPLKVRNVAAPITVTFTKESDWCVWKLSGAAVPPTIPPADPLVTVHQSWLKALQDLANNPQ